MLYLLMLTHLRFKPATIVVTSELPLGSGLGSSVALCVAFSAALFACSDCECGHETREVNFWGVQGFQINQIILTKLFHLRRNWYLEDGGGGCKDRGIDELN
jgi:hypothetical protein